MPGLNWGMIQDGGAFESLMHAILYAEDPNTILFGRPGKDAGQDARSTDGTMVYQAKYRQGLVMDGAITLALEELGKIKDYRQPAHNNHRHWRSTLRWILVANFSINPNDDVKWQNQVVPAFLQEGIAAEYWHIEALEGKLAQHLEIKDVFFCGENRVLVGLKEAHDLLSAECVGSLSLDIPMLGRDSELDLIQNFTLSGDKRLLPVIGPGGIGKSRLLYEGLVSLAQDGWRVLWGLPGTMARSSHWFRLLNGTQRTCVVLDAPDDPGLLRAVVEQLATVERQNWRVIIACRTERAESLRRYRTHRHVHEPVQLGPLNEIMSHDLVNACLNNQAQPSWLHSVYCFTHGVPGWLCLIAELAKRSALSDLPSSADDVAAIYVDSCLNTLGNTLREQGMILLRWLALWGTMKVEPGSTGQAEFPFLEARGISERTARELLGQFVNTGIVRNWGVGKRLFAIEPLIVRQQILSSWLLRANSGTYKASDEGNKLVSLLVEGQVPAADSVLNSLSHLARSRLDEPESYFLLKPIFKAMAEIAERGSVVDQYRVAGLVEKAGVADPESALDVLVTIRESVKKSIDVDVQPWGTQHITHATVVANLPWILFQIAELVTNQTVARRVINEFRQLVALWDAGNLQAGSGKEPRQLLKRILCRMNNSEAFAQSAHDLAVAELTAPTGWPFVGLVTECLLNPVRESLEWVANWTLSITRRVFLPESLEWDLSADLRKKAFVALRNDPQPAFRGPLWGVLADSHHSFHHTVLHGKVKGPAIKAFRAVLVSDLETCAEILRSPPVALMIEEATQARKMWSWYLKYGREDDPVELARVCEQIYNGLSTWRLHDFFRFETEEALAPETARITGLFRNATTPNVYTEFFDEAKRYLDAARKGQEDMADQWRITAIAKTCADLFLIDDSATMNPLTEFVVGVLDQAEPVNPLAWTFVFQVCRHYLLAAKTTAGANVANALSRMLQAAKAKSRLIWALYSNVHPASTGMLTGVELSCILEHETDFAEWEWFVLLGSFYALDQDAIQHRLHDHIDSLRTDPVEASRCLGCFIRSAYIAALRYAWPPAQLPVGWIVDAVTQFQLDGDLLGIYDLEWMRDQASFRLNMVQLAALIRSRIELEQRPKPGDRFEIVPHDFAIGDWARFDTTNQVEVDAFYEFCRMALGGNFTAVYWMPTYIPQIDPSGQHVSDFVIQHLIQNPDMTADSLARLGYLASCYDTGSNEWSMIARPICERAAVMRRNERETIYSRLIYRGVEVYRNDPGGKGSQRFIKACDDATRLRDAEPPDSHLREFREWALNRAEAEFRRERESAEEDADV